MIRGNAVAHLKRSSIMFTSFVALNKSFLYFDLEDNQQTKLAESINDAFHLYPFSILHRQNSAVVVPQQLLPHLAVTSTAESYYLDATSDFLVS